MQGRLSPIENNKIQFFPTETWDKEFYLANLININFMEWTLEYGKLSTPHINLIMEALPYHYYSIEQLNLLLDFELPQLLRYLPRRPKTYHVQ